MIATALFLILVLIETFALCRPLQFIWDKTIDGECSGEDSVYLIVGIVNTVIDVCILMLPMPMVFRLQMTLTRRMSVAAMFSFGALWVHLIILHLYIMRLTDIVTRICIISLLRTIWIQTWDQSDRTYNITLGAIYFVLEPTLGVVNACLPTIKPAITKLFSRRSSGPAGHDPVMQHRPHNKVKGNITREIERVNDELPLYSISIETGSCSETNSGSWGFSNVQFDRILGVGHAPGSDSSQSAFVLN